MTHLRVFKRFTHLPILVLSILAMSIALIISIESLDPLVSVSSANSRTTMDTGYAKIGEGIFKYACADCHHATESSNETLMLQGFTLRGENEKQFRVSQFWKNAIDLHTALEKATLEHTNAAISRNEVYHLTAYILHLNGLIDKRQAIDQDWLISFQSANGRGFGTVWPKR